MALPDSITTARLRLRRSGADNYDRAFAIRSKWNVARNLGGTGFPPRWTFYGGMVRGHEMEWDNGTAYRFAISREARMIGLIDLNDVTDGEGEPGYWLDEASWGQGFGLEAAQAVMAFAF